MSPQHGKHATPDDSSRVLLVLALVQFLTSQVVFSLYLSTASFQAVPNLHSFAMYGTHRLVLAAQSVFTLVPPFRKAGGK